MKIKLYCICALVLVIMLVGCSQVYQSQNFQLLTIRNVTDVFSNNGISLIKSKETISKENLKLNGVKPYVFVLEVAVENHMFVYIYKTIEDRNKAVEEVENHKETFEVFLNEDILSPSLYKAINVLIVFTPKVLVSDCLRIENIVFEELNDTKELIYKGESTNWYAEIILKYYEYWWKDDKNKLNHESYHILRPVLKYKGENFKEVGIVNFEYESSGGGGRLSGVSLDKYGYIYGGCGGGNGAMPREDDIYIITVEWNEKDESFELKIREDEK